MTNVPHDSDDTRSAPMADSERLPNWILTVKERLRKYAIDHDHLAGSHLIGRREESALQQCNSYGLQVIGTSPEIERVWRFLE